MFVRFSKVLCYVSIDTCQKEKQPEFVRLELYKGEIILAVSFSNFPDDSIYM